MPLSRLKTLLLVGLPPLLLAVWLIRFGVNVPFWDQWDAPAIQIIQATQGTLTWNSLWAQHNEHRILFPKLIFIGLAGLGGWQPKLEMGLNFAASILMSWCIYRLSVSTLPVKTETRLGLLVLVNWVVFSPVQWETWLNGFQLPCLMAVLGLVANLMILKANWPPVLTFFTCGVLSTIASFSFANGLMVWLVCFPVLASYALVGRRWWGMIGGWLLWMGVTIGSYLYHYHPTTQSSLAMVLTHPFKAGAFFCAYLGAPLAFGSIVVALGIGMILVTAFACVTGYMLWLAKTSGQFNLLDRQLAWICLGGFAILSALMTTVGRLQLGMGAALSPRYITFSNLLIIAVIYSWALLVTTAPFSRFKRTTLRRIGLVLLALFTACYLATYAFGLRGMVATYRNRIYGKSCLMLLALVQDTGCVEQFDVLYPNRTIVQERSQQLAALGLLHPTLATPAILSNFVGTAPQPDHGKIELITTDPQGNLNLAGWAILPRRTRPADAVLLTTETSAGNVTFVQVVRVGGSRPDIAAQLGRPYRLSGWTTQVAPAWLLPTDSSLTLKAWAFDSQSRQGYLLGMAPLPVQVSNP